MQARNRRINLTRLLAMSCLSALTALSGAPDVAAAAHAPNRNADTFRAVNGAYSARCGSRDIVSCAPADQPGDYVGIDADEVVVRFRVTSDGGWDGYDCLWPNDGAVQLDDVAISLSNGAGYSHDFADGTLGALRVAFPRGGYAASPPPAPAAVSVRAEPNPFNPSTSIRFTVDGPGRMVITIYDLRGQHVRTILDGRVGVDKLVLVK